MIRPRRLGFDLACRHHLLNGALAAEEDTFEVDVQYPDPDLLGVSGGGCRGDGRVCSTSPQASRTQRTVSLTSASHLRPLRNIDLLEDDPATASRMRSSVFGRPRARIATGIGDHDNGALGGETHGDGPAYTRGARPWTIVNLVLKPHTAASTS
jgi:hypothetical protein